MRLLKKFLKWIGLTLLVLSTLVVSAGLITRLTNPKPCPLGNVIDVNGLQMHILAEGQKSEGPTLIIEAGAGGSVEFYHWLSEGVKDRMRVVRYDRAGIGHSEASSSSRDPESIANELHSLLAAAGEAPPYILAGHSMGGPYIRVFAELYPDEVEALIFIDSTHPERVERIGLPTANSTQFKNMILFYNVLAPLGDLGLVKLYDNVFGPMLHEGGLPDSLNDRIGDLLLDGKLIRAARDELRTYHASLRRAGKANNFGNIPIRIFDAQSLLDNEARARYEHRGIDPDERMAIENEMDADFLNLSTNSKLFVLEASHQSIFSDEKNANVICQEILELTGE